MAGVSNKKNELRVLSLLMQPPTHMRVLSLDLDVFSNPDRRKAASIIQKYVKKYKSPPSLSALKSFADQLVESDLDEAEKAHAALMQLRHLPEVAPEDARFEFDRAENYRMGRALIDINEELKENFESGDTAYMGMRQRIISKLLASGTTGDTACRGMIYSRVRERAEAYKRAERGEHGDIIPYGIKSLDDKIGGMRRTFVTLLYSKTGGGKTRTAINIAYNAARAGFNVMYVSLEMAFDLLASCIDARIGWVDSHDIIFGKLNKEDRQKYSDALKKQMMEKLNIWIVDVSKGATSATILEEIEIYTATHGVPPDLVVIDYANLMEPMRKYIGRSEKYDYLFREFHEIAKYANVCLLTMTQESRDASKEDIYAKKKKEEVEQGVHKIGLSNYMAPHCETVIRLKWDSKDKMMNRLWLIIDKDRYGNVGAEIQLTALWDKSYVGDKVITGLRVKRSDTRNKKEELQEIENKLNE